MRFLLSITLLTLLSTPAWAGVDAPGQAMFDFLAEEDRVYPSFEQIPEDAPFDRAETSEVFFSTDASSFGDEGVLMWAGFSLEGDPAGPRYGMLFMDFDLNRAPLDDLTAMPAEAVRAEYVEKRGDEILFEGRPLEGGVWIVDIVFHADDKGAVEGDFAFVFTDPSRPAAGCRVLLRGIFLTDPSPTQLRQSFGTPNETDDGEYVSVGCTGDVYLADDGGGCGGDDADSGGCEGDTSDSGGGCEGDSGGGCEGDSGAGCEGDTGGGCGDAGGGGCGDAGGGACAGAASAAVRPPHRSGGPLRAVLRLFPEICALAFITWMRRRRRP